MSGSAKQSPRDLEGVFDNLRLESPGLDRRIRESGGRRDLALTLARIRGEAGLTQRELADAMGRDQAFVSRMESTAGPFPSSASINAYVHACGAMAGYVFVMPGDGLPHVVTVSLGEAGEAEAIEQAVHSSTGR